MDTNSFKEYLMCEIIIRGEEEHMPAKVLKYLPRNCNGFPHVCLPGFRFFEHLRKRV